MSDFEGRPPGRRLWHHRLEEGLLVGTVACLLALAFAQILLRNLFQVTLVWADPLLRHLVLWSSFLGALIATRQGQHIRIDGLLRLLPPPWRRLAAAGGDLAAAAVCLLLGGIAVRFVADERAAGGVAFLGLPQWWLQLVFPVVFLAMGLRFAGRSLALLRQR